jgi:cytoskeletal protein CcmA (bactofilin family)
MSLTSRKQQLLALFVGLAVVLAVLPGAVSAQSGAGGTVTVESGETVSRLSGAYGTIIVEGTVTGDVSGAAGSVVIRDGGVVEGDLEAASGNIRIAGTVNGGVSTGAGSIYLTETGVVDGDFEVGAGDVRIEGTINGDAKIGAETIRLGEAATIAGSLTYDGDLQGNRDAVQGDITRDRSLGPSIFTDLQPFASWVFSLYALLANFLLGALLLGLFPQFSDRVADRVATDPLRSGLAGLGTMLGVPVLLVLVAITVIGIPLSVAGLLAFVLFVWIGLVYGRFAVGMWLLSLADVDNRWGALVAGLLVAAVLGQIPVAGGLANFVIVLLGLGALVVELVSRRQRITGTSKEQTDSAPVD